MNGMKNPLPKSILNEKKCLNILMSAVLSVIAALIIVVGIMLDENKGELLNLGWLWCAIILAIPFWGFFLFITKQLDILENRIIKRESMSPKTLKKFFLIVVIVWFAGYLAMFPGVYATDAPWWYYEFSNSDIQISSQWSPLYAGVFYYIVEFGNVVFKSFTIGFAIFTFIQMTLILRAVWSIIDFLNEYLGKFMVALSVVFFSVIPTHNILAVTSAQDGLFAALFAINLIHLLRINLEGDTYLNSKKNIIIAIITLFLFCAVRNNGLYTVLFFFLFALCFIKRNKRKLIAILLVVMSLAWLYQGPFYDVVNIQKGSAIREMLSLPLQQMAYVYNHNENLSPELKIKMQQYISDEAWKTYKPCISDPIKGQLNTDFVKNNSIEFVKLYIDVGKTNFSGYCKGLLYQTYALLYPGKFYPDARIWHPYINYLSISKDLYNTGVHIPRISLIPPYNNLLGWLFGEGNMIDGYGGDLFMGFSEIPIWSLFCKAGIYTWLLFYTLLYSLKRQRWEFVGILGYALGLFLTIFLSPVILYRYAAPLVFASPLIFSMLFLDYDK